MDYDALVSVLKSYEAFAGEILADEPLAPKTTFKVGGTTALFVKPDNYYSFQILLDELLEKEIPFFVLGGGSNVVFADGRYDGVVISTQNFSDVDILRPEDCPEEFGKITLQKNQVLVTCFSGTPMASLVNFCTGHNICGVEKFAGLPGSVGGAVFMNARCFEQSVSDCLFSVTYMDYSGARTELRRCRMLPHEWGYKKSPFQGSRRFITTVTLLLEQRTAGAHKEIAAECRRYVAERVSKGHFSFPSAGSVFKNNREFGSPSGKIIDDAGLKGYAIGGAQVAPFHGNFIINKNKATAADIKALVAHIQKAVREKTGFLLEPEIIFVE